MNKGYKSIPLTFSRQAVIASASVTKEKNTIHSITEIDITEPVRLIREHFDKTGENLARQLKVEIYCKWIWLQKFKKKMRRNKYQCSISLT